ncbi:MAG: alpha amylase C-terminal domain-containing protein [Ardenticatenaceae bacterium]|nr:alpha amylase C-terminal domain-containing protein [Ardenticatenaceae bacterium]
MLDWRGFWDRAVYETKRLLRPVQPTAVSGLGAMPNGVGTAFRVWAPHADKVFVTGSFNDWSPWRAPLAAENNGFWSADVPHATVGDTYKILLHHQGELFLRADPYTRALDGAHGNSVITRDAFTWDDDTFQMPEAADLVIYELHVGTFAADSPAQIGTFAGVQERLPYLRDLGVNAIELMPVMEFAGDYSWGYNPAQPFAITRTYGGREALQQLVKAAHAHGIAVIVDVVYNHFGPQDLDLWRFDGWHEDGKGGLYFYNDWRSKTPWADTRPDYGRSEVRQYIGDNVRMWLTEFHVDGLRWDATNYIRNAHGHDGDRGADIAEGWQLMQTINAEVQAQFPGKLLIAEDLQQNPWLTKPVAENGAGFTAQWDAAFVHPLRQALITPDDELRDVTAVAAALSFTYNQDPFARVIYTESHDEVANGKARVPEEIAPGQADTIYARQRAALGAALVFTAPGIPMIFQGQEFLESGWFDDHVPLDWRKAEANAGMCQFYRDLMTLRHDNFGISRGLRGAQINVYHVNDEAKLLAFHRWDNGGPRDDVVVIANFSHRAIESYAVGMPRSGLWRVRLNSDDRAYDASFGSHYCPDPVAAAPRSAMLRLDDMPFFANVTLAPYSVLILSQD